LAGRFIFYRKVCWKYYPILKFFKKKALQQWVVSGFSSPNAEQISNALVYLS